MWRSEYLYISKYYYLPFHPIFPFQFLRTTPTSASTKMQLPSGRVRRICWKRSTKASTWAEKSRSRINEKVVTVLILLKVRGLKSSLRLLNETLFECWDIPIHQIDEWWWTFMYAHTWDNCTVYYIKYIIYIYICLCIVPFWEMESSPGENTCKAENGPAFCKKPGFSAYCTSWMDHLWISGCQTRC